MRDSAGGNPSQTPASSKRHDPGIVGSQKSLADQGLIRRLIRLGGLRARSAVLSLSTEMAVSSSTFLLLLIISLSSVAVGMGRGGAGGGGEAGDAVGGQSSGPGMDVALSVTVALSEALSAGAAPNALCHYHQCHSQTF